MTSRARLRLRAALGRLHSHCHSGLCSLGWSTGGGLLSARRHAARLGLMYATQNGGCICELASLSSTARLDYFFVLLYIDTLGSDLRPRPAGRVGPGGAGGVRGIPRRNYPEPEPGYINQLKHHQCGRGGAGLLPGVRALLLRLGRDDDGRRCDARRASSDARRGDGAGGAVRRRFARASRARPSSWRLSSDSRSRGVPTAPHVISGDSLPPGRIRGVIGTRPSSAAEVVSDDTEERSG